MGNVRLAAIGYHGVANVKFAPLKGDAYDTAFIAMPGAKNLNFTSLLENTELYGDNRLLLSIPNDKGYTVDFGVNAAIPELEKAAGYAIEGANGLISANVVQYICGAVYYEFIEVGRDKRPYTVKVWALNSEVGKGAPAHSTDGKSIEFGDYKYSCTVYGDTLMDAQGVKAFIDDLGMGRTAFLYYARPTDTDYSIFGDTVPVPKVKAVPPPAPLSK